MRTYACQWLFLVFLSIRYSRCMITPETSSQNAQYFIVFIRRPRCCRLGGPFCDRDLPIGMFRYEKQFGESRLQT